MKYLYTFLVIACMGTWTFAQEDDDYQSDEDFQTIFGGREVGGYGAIAISYSTINNRNAINFSGRGGVVLGHSFSMGFGGSGFVNEYKYNGQLETDVSLTGGYGGIYLEFILAPKLPVHLSFPVLGGFGGIAYTTWDRDNSDYTQVNNILDTETFMILEPGVEVEFNLVRWCRMAFYGTYRFTTDLSLRDDVSPNALQGYTAGVIFKFGKF